MRLFLASQDFGNYVDRLSAMVGKNRKTLVVTNARDYSVDKGVEAQKELFAANDLDFYELDLRKYFGQQEELEKFVDEYQPGAVILLGGNVFLLRRALYQSGFDEILKRDVCADKYVLAGHSAGAIVAGSELHEFERLDDATLVLPGYQEEIIWGGLGLTSMAILPHADSEKYGNEVARLSAEFEKENRRHVVLNDSDVFVVDNLKEEVLR